MGEVTIHAIDLIKILPEYFRPVLEFKEIIKADEAVLAELETNIEQIRKNFLYSDSRSSYIDTERGAV